MSKRIRQLEDALHIAHSSMTPNGHPHPLLTDELLSIKTGVDLPEEEEPVDEVPELAISLGTLAISHGGKSLFVGNVGSEASSPHILFFVDSSLPMSCRLCY